MQVLIFEDGRRGRFGPLTTLRPAFDLRVGALTLAEKLTLRRPDWQVAFLPRPELAELVAAERPGASHDDLGDGPTLVLLANVLADDVLLSALSDVEPETLLTSGGMPVGGLLSQSVRDRLVALAGGRGLEDLGLVRSEEVPARIISYPWELVRLAEEEIPRDIRLLVGSGAREGTIHESAVVTSAAALSMDKGSSVGPGAVIDTADGPVHLARGAAVMAHAYVQGPAFVGEGSLVKVGAKIYEGTVIGPGCKIGGEVECSTILGWSNKQHDGFLGHAYVGHWVNLGAGTDVSDLKNTYGTVRVTMNGETIDTESCFVGPVIGDHAKTAIGTRLNTGTVVGVFANVATTGFPPKEIPAFSWLTGDGISDHDIERALETARVVMGRRGQELSPPAERLIRALHAEATGTQPGGGGAIRGT
jgi:UDP-N-acetylglucosamine diphosphorylase/glucosamine-1-phosphate N-acetyltransferase